MLTYLIALYTCIYTQNILYFKGYEGYKGGSVTAKNEMMIISSIFICSKSSPVSLFVLIITNYIPDVGGRHHQKKEDAPRQFSPTRHRKGINYNLVLENTYLSL